MRKLTKITDMDGVVQYAVGHEPMEVSHEAYQKALAALTGLEVFGDGHSWDKDQATKMWAAFGSSHDTCVAKARAFADNPDAFCAGLMSMATGTHPRWKTSLKEPRFSAQEAGVVERPDLYVKGTRVVVDLPVGRNSYKRHAGYVTVDERPGEDLVFIDLDDDRHIKMRHHEVFPENSQLKQADVDGVSSEHVFEDELADQMRQAEEQGLPEPPKNAPSPKGKQVLPIRSSKDAWQAGYDQASLDKQMGQDARTEFSAESFMDKALRTNPTWREQFRAGYDQAWQELSSAGETFAAMTQFAMMAGELKMGKVSIARLQEVLPKFPGFVRMAMDQTTFKVVVSKPFADGFEDLLNYIKGRSDPGHSFAVVVDPGDEGEESFGVDGDGSEHILSVTREGDEGRVESSLKKEAKEWDPVKISLDQLNQYQGIPLLYKVGNDTAEAMIGDLSFDEFNRIKTVTFNLATPDANRLKIEPNQSIQVNPSMKSLADLGVQSFVKTSGGSTDQGAPATPAPAPATTTAAKGDKCKRCGFGETESRGTVRYRGTTPKGLFHSDCYRRVNEERAKNLNKSAEFGNSVESQFALESFFIKGNRWSAVEAELKKMYPDLGADGLNSIKSDIEYRLGQHKIQIESALTHGIEYAAGLKLVTGEDGMPKGFTEENRTRWSAYWKSLGSSLPSCVGKLKDAAWIKGESEADSFCAQLHQFVEGKRS